MSDSPTYFRLRTGTRYGVVIQGQELPVHAWWKHPAFRDEDAPDFRSDFGPADWWEFNHFFEHHPKACPTGLLVVGPKNQVSDKYLTWSKENGFQEIEDPSKTGSKLGSLWTCEAEDMLYRLRR